MIECLVSFSTWVEGNSGQFQIGIALIALTYAWKAYRKVLDQIDISNNQTNLTITQMTKYNEERVFELKLRLKIRVNEDFKVLMDLQDACNDLSYRLQELSIDTQTNHPSSFEAVDMMIKGFRETLNLSRDFISEKFRENTLLIKNISESNDQSVIENTLDKLESNQNIYHSKMREIKNINSNVNNIWLPMKVGVSEAILRRNNLS